MYIYLYLYIYIYIYISLYLSHTEIGTRLVIGGISSVGRSQGVLNFIDLTLAILSLSFNIYIYIYIHTKNFVDLTLSLY